MTLFFKTIGGLIKTSSGGLLTTTIGLCYMAFMGQYILGSGIYKQFAVPLYKGFIGFLRTYPDAIFYYFFLANCYIFGSVFTDNGAIGYPGPFIEYLTLDTNGFNLTLFGCTPWAVFQFTALENNTLDTLTGIDYGALEQGEHLKDLFFYTFRWNKGNDEVVNLQRVRPTDEEILAGMEDPDNFYVEAGDLRPKPRFKISKVTNEIVRKPPTRFNLFTPGVCVDDYNKVRGYVGPMNTNYTGKKSTFLKRYYESERISYQFFSPRFESNLRVLETDNYFYYDVPKHRLSRKGFHEFRYTYKKRIYEEAKKKNYIP